MGNTVTDLKYDNEVLLALQAGVDKLANTVKVTLGPKGNFVTIQKQAQPNPTKDGVTVARSIGLLDQFEDMGAKLVLQAASKTNETSGDGTTTATILAQALLSEGIKAISNGSNRVDIKDGILLATKAVIKHLKDSARAVTTDEQLLHVGNIASNGEEEISKIIVDAINIVGADGVITYQGSNNISTSVEFVKGFQFAKGYHSSVYCNQPDRPVCELKDVHIFLTTHRLNYKNGIIPYLSAVAEKGGSILIIADEIEGEANAALQGLAVNRQMDICCVKAPSHGELRDLIMEDIATLTGGKINFRERGTTLANGEEASYLGYAKRVVVKQDSTTIIDGKHNAETFKNYCNKIFKTYEAEVDEQQKAILKERHSRLTNGVANIKVGGATEGAVKELIYRVEDALNACLSAKLEGILPGGGIALLRASTKVLDDLKGENEDQDIGIKIVKRSLSYPIKQLAENAGKDISVILNKINESKDNDFGWDAAQNIYGNMYNLGIIDPLKIVRNALEAACSSACLMLMTRAMVADHIVMSPGGNLSGQVIY